MNRANEAALAWAMAKSVVTRMHPDDHTWLCAKIGAGEQESAIGDILVFYATSDVKLPHELTPLIQDWLRGYAGTDIESDLRSLYDRIDVSARSKRDAGAAAPDRRQLIATRSERAMRARSRHKRASS